MTNNKEITLRLVKAQKNRLDSCCGCYFDSCCGCYFEDTTEDYVCYLRPHSPVFDCKRGYIWVKVKTDKGNISDDIKQETIDS